MPQIDFITAFSRLLRDASLREAYAREPEKVADRLEVGLAYRTAFLGLDREDLEFQAEVLLRKRFDALTRFLPETCARAGAQAWPWFIEFARNGWPAITDTPVLDALKFCEHLATKDSSSPVDSEVKRARFIANNTFLAFHIVHRGCVHGQRRSCLQVLFRTNGGCWHELLIFFGLGRPTRVGIGGSAPRRESMPPSTDKGG